MVSYLDYCHSLLILSAPNLATFHSFFSQKCLFKKLNLILPPRLTKDSLLCITYKTCWSVILVLFCMSISFATDTSFCMSQIKCNSFQDAFLNILMKQIIILQHRTIIVSFTTLMITNHDIYVFIGMSSLLAWKAPEVKVETPLISLLPNYLVQCLCIVNSMLSINICELNE